MARRIEKTIQVALAGLAVVLLGPLGLCLALLIYLVDGRPVLVSDMWTDRRGKSLTLSSFRTHQVRSFSGEVSPPLPWLGWYLQRSGLEKLPRLLDILAGRCELDALWR